VDLRESDTIMLVKMKSKANIATELPAIQEVASPLSNYQTLDEYVNGEEVLLDEEHEKDIRCVQEIEESPRDDEIDEVEPGENGVKIVLDKASDFGEDDYKDPQQE
jgi:hypothetical protein